MQHLSRHVRGISGRQKYKPCRHFLVLGDDQKAASTLRFHQPLRLPRILVFVEIHDGNVRAFPGEEQGDGPTDSVVSAGDQGCPVPQCRNQGNRSRRTSAGAASCIGGPVDVADVGVGGLFSLLAWRKRNRFWPGSQMRAGERKISAEKCVFAVDGWIRLATLLTPPEAGLPYRKTRGLVLA